MKPPIYFRVGTWITCTVSALLNPVWAIWGIGVALRGWLGFSQELAGGGEIVGRLPGAGVIPRVALRSGEGVFAKPAGCLKLTQRQERGGEFVCGIDGEVAFVTGDSPGSGKRVRSESLRCFMFAECVQIASKVNGEANGPGMVFAKYSPCPGEAVFMQLSCLIDLAERA